MQNINHRFPKFNASIWIIIPGYNEQKYIGQVLDKVKKITPNVIVVDDGSTDQLGKLAKDKGARVITHAVNLGKGAALKTGCELAFNQLGAKAVIFMDSDDQHDPADLWKFHQKLSEGESVVFGVREFDQNMPLIRIIFNRLASVVVLALFGGYIPDIPCGFKALSHHGYQRVSWKSRDYAVEMEIAARTAKNKMKFATVGVATIYHDLDRGMTGLDTIAMITRIISWRFNL